MLRLLRGRAAAGLSLEDEQRTGVLTQRASVTPLTCGLHLQRPGWAWSSSRVGAGLWCGAPGLGAPRGAAHPHRPAEGPILWPAAPGGGWKEEEGLPHGWEPPPELCPGQTPSLWTQREGVKKRQRRDLASWSHWSQHRWDPQWVKVKGQRDPVLKFSGSSHRRRQRRVASSGPGCSSSWTEASPGRGQKDVSERPSQARLLKTNHAGLQVLVLVLQDHLVQNLRLHLGLLTHQRLRLPGHVISLRRESRTDGDRQTDRGTAGRLDGGSPACAGTGTERPGSRPGCGRTGARPR